MLRALIFDVDGTLAETEDLHRQAFNGAFADLGLPWSWSPARYADLLTVMGGKERLRHYVETGMSRLLNKRIELSALHRAGYEFPVELAITPIGERFETPGLKGYLE